MLFSIFMDAKVLQFPKVYEKKSLKILNIAVVNYKPECYNLVNTLVFVLY